MKALLLFHIRVGVRIAIKAAAPLFCAFLAMIMFQMYPAAVVKAIALSLFRPHPAIADILPLVAVALLLPAWAAPRLVVGLNGWMRHLAIGGAANRRGMGLSLVVTQMPLVIALALLALIAHNNARPVSGSLLRFSLLLVAGAFASLPVKRRYLSQPLALSAAACSLSANWAAMIAGAGCLVVVDLFGGPLREPERRTVWSAVGSFFSLRIAWRALGWRILSGYAPSLLALGGTALFASNNQLPGPLLSATVRFGGGMAIGIYIALLAEKLAVRRPVWPWARSLPWSSMQRIGSDAFFLAIHTAPLLVIVMIFEPGAGLLILALLPLMAIRASGALRRARERKTGTGTLVMESFLTSASIAILPWTAMLFVAAAAPAFWMARRDEIRHKVTRWREMHYLTAGDPLSWSEQ